MPRPARTARPRRDSASQPGRVPLLPDEQLVPLLRGGDEASFCALLDAYHGPLIRLALGFVKDHAAAQEVVQDTWAAVVEGLARFEGRSSLKTWIFRVLVNHATTRGQRDARFTPFSAMEEVGTAEPAVDPARFGRSGRWAAPPQRWDEGNPERLALNGQAMDALSSALSDLAPAQRAVVTLREIEGLSSVEVCNVLKISETNQRVLLHRAKAKLRCALEQVYGAE